jgi:hypothetical protein
MGAASTIPEGVKLQIFLNSRPTLEIRIHWILLPSTEGSFTTARLA